jgi:hypothetical protein
MCLSTSISQIHECIVQIARDHRVAAGRDMRVDTTVVETNIHYPGAVAGGLPDATALG